MHVHWSGMSRSLSGSKAVTGGPSSQACTSPRVPHTRSGTQCLVTPSQLMVFKITAITHLQTDWKQLLPCVHTRQKGEGSMVWCSEGLMEQTEYSCNAAWKRHKLSPCKALGRHAWEMRGKLRGPIPKPTLAWVGVCHLCPEKSLNRIISQRSFT